VSELDQIRLERKKWMGWKNIAPIRERLESLEEIECTVELGDTIKIESTSKIAELDTLAKMMMPWRKGPFDLLGLHIDAEWQSFMKFNLLKPHLNIKGKIVADVGCNNGYYMFRMLDLLPSKLVGFDPSAIYKTQFDFINHFVKSDICYELLGVEHLALYEHKFDTILCLGVLYHRSDPVGMLKQLKAGMHKDSELFLDTFIIFGDSEFCLSPENSYSKIPNIYFIPTLKVLTNWLKRAGFRQIEVIDILTTSTLEQRKTEWIEGESLSDFLDPNNQALTVEGYQAPTRAYLKVTL